MNYIVEALVVMPSAGMTTVTVYGPVFDEHRAEEIVVNLSANPNVLGAALKPVKDDPRRDMPTSDRTSD